MHHDARICDFWGVASLSSVKKSLSKSGRGSIHPRQAFLFEHFMLVEGGGGHCRFSGKRQSQRYGGGSWEFNNKEGTLEKPAGHNFQATKWSGLKEVEVEKRGR